MALILLFLVAALICCAIAVKFAIGFMFLAAKVCVVLMIGLGVATVAKAAFFSK